MALDGQSAAVGSIPRTFAHKTNSASGLPNLSTIRDSEATGITIIAKLSSMQVSEIAEAATQSLASTRDLYRAGLTDHDITRGLADGSLFRLRRGWYVAAKVWSAANPQQRQITAAIATSRAASGQTIFSHRTAATLLGLPVWSGWLNHLFPPSTRAGSGASKTGNNPDPQVVHLTSKSNSRLPSNGLMVRHRKAITEEDLCSTAGLTHTSAELTLFNLARSEPFAIALACTDEWLRKEVRLGRLIDEQRWQAWRDRLKMRIAQSPHSNGMRAARTLEKLAHPGSDSVLESVSRLRCLQVGIDVKLQVPVRAENGGYSYLDFLFEELGVFGECDGKAKYTDAQLRDGRSADEVLYDEKLRHDWITGTTNMRGMRWGSRDVETTEKFSRRVRAFHVPVPGVPVRSYGDQTAEFLARLP